MPITAAAPPPPKTPRKTAASAPAASHPADKTTERSQGLKGWAQIGEAFLIGFRQYADAATVSMYSPPVCDEVAKLAEDNDKIASIVDPVVSTGPYGALLAALLPMFAQLAVNHGRIKAGAMGTVSPDLLTARVEADLARAQARALREQQEAEAEAERLQQEIQRTRAVVPSRVVA